MIHNNHYQIIRLKMNLLKRWELSYQAALYQGSGRELCQTKGVSASVWFTRANGKFL